MINKLVIILGALNTKFIDSRLELPMVSFNHQDKAFIFEFGHAGEMIELELSTDLTMISQDMSADEIANQVKWLYMDAKYKHTNWVFNDG